MSRAKKNEGTSNNANFFESMVKATQNTLAGAASNGISAGDINGFIDTGVYLLNGQLSGSMYGGIPDNKIFILAGPEAVGKTYFILSMIKHYLDNDPEAGVVYFESESAISKKMLEQRGIDTTRVFIVPVSTVQQFRTQALKILAEYEKAPLSKRRPMLFALDSLGMLSTTKEVEDTESGSETKDMTRAALIKAAFRVLTLRLGILNVPLVVTNHTYDEQGKMFAQKVMSGGSGAKYANSGTLFLSKAKEKDGTETTGVIITCTLKKGRLTKENTQVKVRLNYAKGLHKYYGLLDLAAKHGLVKKLDKKYAFSDGTSAFEKAIYKDPTKYFTSDLMDELEKVVQKEFLYGSAIEISDDDFEEEDDEDIQEDVQSDTDSE